ncbi:MAG: hypothetical protein ACTHN0_19010 [Aquihabitans sp.]
MLPAALFQRKSRSGWLEELDGIREDALDQHDGGVANVVDADDIWTDLRDGGEYEDPHEISSLYATDETPDRPVSKPSRPVRTPRQSAKAADAPPPAPSSPVEAFLPPPPAAAEALPPPPAVVEAPLPPPPAPPVVEEPAASIPVAIDPVGHDATVKQSVIADGAGEAPAPSSSQYDDQIWVQPAPHPIRPSEMWHPAELAPAPLAEESFEPVLEERVASADLMDPTYHPRHEAPAAEVVAAPEPAEVQLEAEPVARADVAEPVAPAGNLVNGPVGRRVRRDRPADRPKASLPPPEAHQPLADRGEQSPLPSPALPPAALPTRSNRLPGLDLPATPSSVVPPRPAPAPVAPDPAAEPVPAVPAPAPAPAPEAPAPVAIAIGDVGLVAAPGTIVRIGGERRARALGSPDGVVVGLDEGWCWASPGDGAAAALRIDLPAGSLTVEPGATALAVVEADGSVFLVVAAGSAHLERGGDGAPIARGTIVMIDPSGAAQTDAATDAEIEADPIVAENLALDAEL